MDAPDICIYNEAIRLGIDPVNLDSRHIISTPMMGGGSIIDKYISESEAQSTCHVPPYWLPVSDNLLKHGMCGTL